VVDVAEHKHPLPLGVTPRTDYAAGPCAASFACDGIDVASVAPRHARTALHARVLAVLMRHALRCCPRSWLNNIGLLKLVLRDAAGEEVAVASMLTQIVRRCLLARVAHAWPCR
jgi:hypothetical protein